MEPSAGRLLFVHAHPDDETINNGVTMAKYAAAGAHVALVTCTRGEEGEIIPPELAHLASHETDGLGDHRVGELAAAMAALGVTDHRFLDECGAAGPRAVRYRDSGMAWGEGGVAVPAPDTKDGAFALSDVEEAAGRLADVVRSLRPHVVVTYEPGGGYGHPDHVRAHDVTMRAVALAEQDGADGAAAWPVPKVYEVVIPEGVFREMLRQMAADGADSPFAGWSADGPLPTMFVPDAEVTAVVEGNAFVGAKADALRAHATQVAVDGPFFALSNGVGQPLAGFETYRLVRGTAVVRGGSTEDDLLAGL